MKSPLQAASEHSLPERIPGKPAATPVIAANSIRAASAAAAAAESQQHRGAAALGLADAVDSMFGLHHFTETRKRSAASFSDFKSAR